MNKNIFLALTLVTSSIFANQSLFLGTIQYPAVLKKVPSVRIYYGGNKITGEPNDKTKQLIFSIPEIGEKMVGAKRFYLVITESIQFEIEENTVKYIKISQKQAYTCVKIEQIKHESMVPSSHPGEKGAYTWRITKQSLPDNRQLPDNTVVICMPPAYIDRIEGGSKAELPRIFIKNNIVDLAGSEKKLHDEETELLLSAIDTDALHSKINREIKNQNTKTLIACKDCV